MATEAASRELVLEPANNDRLANLCGQFNEHIKHIEKRLDVEIHNRGNRFELRGGDEAVGMAERVLRRLYAETGTQTIDPERVHLSLAEQQGGDTGEEEVVQVHTRRGMVRPRGRNQRHYLNSIHDNDLNFGIGPAGTGKTYLAVACAVEALNKEQVRRLVLTRPAVEAGERLGFLPGDMAQKVDPYMRPVYDALYEMLGFDRVGRLIDQNIIEVAPLAFMRGRTLNDAFVILDEAQNSTVEQMKMFLTRIGFGTKAVVTGDITQIDLPKASESGLRQAMRILEDVPGIGFTYFEAGDVVRHRLVQDIVRAYERADK